MHDPRLLPDIKPDFAISPLLAAEEEVAEEAPAPLPPPPSETEMPYWGSQYTGPDRRAPPDRRAQAEPYKGPERRGHVFGRRRVDPPIEGIYK